jgi:hypothetical protein
MLLITARRRPLRRAAFIFSGLLLINLGFHHVALAQVPPTGSISGRITDQRCPPEQCPDSYSFLLVPVTFEQPLSLLDFRDYGHATDTDGTFVVVELNDGEYFLAPIIERAEQFVTPLPETVEFEEIASGATSAPALRVQVADGQATEGIEIVFRSRDPGMTQDGVPPSPTTADPQLSLPPVGAQPHASSNLAMAIAMSLAVLGVALTAGVALLRLRAEGRQ